MKRVLEKCKTQVSKIQVKIFLLFLLLVLLPYFLLTRMTYQMFLDYTGRNWGKSMEDTLISISSQVSSLLDSYERNTMNLYYSGCVDMIERGEADRETIEATLNTCCYSNSGVKSAYLVSGDTVYYSGFQYGNFVELMEPYQEEIKESGGKCLWYTTTELYGRGESRSYVLARALNGKNETNIGILYYIVSERIITNAFSRLQMDDCLKYLVDRDGNILYASENSAGKVFMPEEMPEFEEGSGYLILRDGKRQEVLAYDTMPDVGWTFCSYISLDNLMETLFSMQKILVMISVSYGLFLILIFYLFQKHFLKPISDLKYAMTQFAEGNMEVRMKESRGGDLKSLATHFNSMTDKINGLIRHNQEVINEKNNFKMQVLMAKLHPHFVFNALNTIKWMSVINHQENIQKVTEALIYILMNNAREENSDYCLGDEIELIRQYAVIQKARFMNFEMEFDVEESALSCRIFQFLLQPVVENAIVHGFQRGMSRGGRILVQGRLEGGTLRLLVRDNGCGFDVERWEANREPQANHTNIGLRYIRQILQLEYGGEASLEITSRPGEGTDVSYRIPAVFGGEAHDPGAGGG